MKKPEISSYKDVIEYFRDCHKAVLATCDELEHLLKRAEERGLFRSFAEDEGWAEVFRFFTTDAPRHEIEEETMLFPVLAQRVPHIGFQPAAAPIHFLVEGHEVMQHRMIELVRSWQAFLKAPHDTTALAEASSARKEEDQAFLATGRELVQLYREHVALEEERIYSVAARELTGAQRLELADILRGQMTKEAVSRVLPYDAPQFSDPKYAATSIETDLQSDLTVGQTEEDEDASDDVAYERF